jgi:hypothetical protein
MTKIKLLAYDEDANTFYVEMDTETETLQQAVTKSKQKLDVELLERRQ